MGQAKLKRRLAFAPELIAEWEADNCVNFAIALARLTGWLLHVDWWVPSTDPNNIVPTEHWKPLRVYVADQGQRVFDVRGTKSIDDFVTRTIKPLAMPFGMGGVRTRFYEEDALSTLPLRVAPDPIKVSQAKVAIEANEAFLAAIPRRVPPCIPAAEAAQYTFGLCAAFAQALQELKGFEPVALLVIRFKPGWQGTECGADGYVHSLVLHADGTGEDSWGQAPLSDIAARFGVAEYRLSHEAHARVVANLQRNSPERYEAAVEKAKALISTYRN
ncbi:MAG: hypothetical protein JZU58_11185 [Curvibacter lanceolatus]|jgi:hypothetical protein|uniref:hypothetical protein n=1 Tax=Curvibacter lanceolatus TaxID=86182 RepID=UPI00235752B1|nr:hypothetical protein [Curvibacter lanceolatus]MBV5292902.1 hypothetical protein [Curvibacter lanceolatus]